MNDNPKQLHEKVQAIEERNERVEADKAWETSWTRRIAIFLLTYIVVVLFMYVSDISEPWINATIPAFAFVLSGVTLPVIKQWWVKKK